MCDCIRTTHTEELTSIPIIWTQIYARKFVVINPHPIPGTCNIADKIKQLHNTTVCSKSPTLPPEVEEEE
jgi:hypothetical protein